GVPVGQQLQNEAMRKEDRGSIIIVIATDAPLLPHQLKRLARRAAMGLARNGSTSGTGSGDIFIAFSTANPTAAADTGLHQLNMLPNERMNPLFGAVVESTEEAILNAMFAAETMVGVDNHKVDALPIEPVREILKKYNRLAQ